MPRKFRLYQRKNAEWKKIEKSSSSTVSNKSSSSEQLSSDVSSEVLSALQTPTSPATEQTEVQAVSDSGLCVMHSSIVLPDSWSDQSLDGLENILVLHIKSSE